MMVLQDHIFIPSCFMILISISNDHISIILDTYEVLQDFNTNEQTLYINISRNTKEIKVCSSINQKLFKSLSQRIIYVFILHRQLYVFFKQ